MLYQRAMPLCHIANVRAESFYNRTKPIGSTLEAVKRQYLKQPHLAPPFREAPVFFSDHLFATTLLLNYVRTDNLILLSFLIPPLFIFCLLQASFNCERPSLHRQISGNFCSPWPPRMVGPSATLFAQAPIFLSTFPFYQVSSWMMGKLAVFLCYYLGKHPHTHPRRTQNSTVLV